MEKAPKYFDYLHKYGQYLTERFSIRCESDSLEADIAKYRRRRSDENTYWIPAVYLRRLLEQIVDGFLVSCPYEYGKELGKKLHGGIDDGYVPRTIGHKMSALNVLVRSGAHSSDNPYSASDLEEALIQLDIVLRAILESAGKSISGDEVESGTDDVLLAHSDSIEEKGKQAAWLTGDERLAKESRAANRRAMAAERDAQEARKQAQEAVRANEQLRLELDSALRTIQEQKAVINKKAAAYAKGVDDTESTESFFAKMSARADAKAAKLQSMQAESDAKTAEAKELSRAKEIAVADAAEEVSELEERLDSILSEYDFISTLLGARGHATDEQRRIVNFPLDSTRKSRLLKVTGKAGTGKTLCLLAALINYLEPNRQRMLFFDDGSIERRALFICYNKDLASYIRGLLERFPQLSGTIEVVNYDKYLNQLVRTSPVEGYEHLSKYATDVRFQPYWLDGMKRYWNLIVNKGEKRNLIRQSIMSVRDYYQNHGMQEYCGSPFLDDRDDFNVSWMVDEIEWLEGRFRSIEDGKRYYPGAERVGRGAGRRLAKNSIERMLVCNVWDTYNSILKERHLYTYQQIVGILLQSNSLPTYDIVAIDEAQDLNILHIELFARFRAEGGYLLIAGDEGQRLYPRDFSWREVDKRVKSITLPLSTNMRNPAEIRRFADRLENDASVVEEVAHDVSGIVRVRREPRANTVAYVKELACRIGETTAVVTTEIGAWEYLLRNAGIVTETSKDYGASSETIRMSNGGVRPGVYCFSQFRAKGLEFDNVIIDYTGEIDKRDERRERRIRYMQFTRARKTLCVRYDGEAPKLLKKYYADFLS